MRAHAIYAGRSQQPKMKKEKQIQIANSFSKLNVESKLDITITDKEFQILKNGIFAKSMDEKWNIFVLKDNIYFSRSWTNYCIYKVRYEIEKQSCRLNQVFIARDSNQYRFKSLEQDLNMFKRLLQMYINREDIFIDERLQLDLIKKTIEKYDPSNQYKKSIGQQSVELNCKIYHGLLKSSSDMIEVKGLKEFLNNSSKYDKDHNLLSLYLLKRIEPKEATTFYFNEDASEYVGQITIIKKEGS